MALCRRPPGSLESRSNSAALLTSALNGPISALKWRIRRSMAPIRKIGLRRMGAPSQSLDFAGQRFSLCARGVVMNPDVPSCSGRFQRDNAANASLPRR